MKRTGKPRRGRWAAATGLRTRILLSATAPVAVSAVVLALHRDVPRVAVVDALAAGILPGLLLAGRQIGDLLRTMARLRISAQRMALEDGSDEILGRDAADLGEVAEQITALSNAVRRALREAREKEQETEAVFARMADGILLVDGDLRVRRLNPAAAEILALPAERALGHTVIEATMLHALDGLFREALSAGETRMRRIETIQPRRRLLQVLVTPLEGGDSGRGAVAVLQDLTEFDRVERVRRDFVTNVSHELRTPVTSIKVMAESLQRGAINDEELRDQFLHSIGESADRLARLVDDVLALARVEAGPGRLEWQPVRLDELVREVASAQAALAHEYRIKLVAEELEPAVVTGDPEGLRQAVTNLVVNGVKYNRPWGQVRLRLESAADEVRLEVADTGIGIPSEHLPRVFERFYRVDRGRSRELGGTGLGLAIVKHVAESHGGQVQVESTVGEGSTFRILLPPAIVVPGTPEEAQRI